MKTMNLQTSPNQVPQQRFFHPPRFQNSYQKTSNFYVVNQFRQQQIQNIEFDGKRLRKAVARKTVDYNSSVIKYLECRIWQRDYRDRRAIQTDVGYYTELMPPLAMIDNPINAVTTKFVRTSTNKMRCPIFCVAWTPEGRRLVTGASSGEFTLWNGLTFNFETILQAHDSPVRCMVWSHNDLWMVTGDHSGYVKYWQSNMNNVKMFQAHKEPLRGISFCPTDAKFATCSDDGTVRIWDFMRCAEERILRGHGADVKCLDWHPQKGLIVSGSKDSQQPIKLWDPKMGQSLATIHAHKSTVMEVKWNSNGNWLLTASRDHLLKLFDIRKMSQEVQTFRGHKKEACSLAWHPVHETLFASGGSDGSLMFWVVGADKEVGGMEQAHDSCVWSLAWHPLGHILCSGSNDHTSKFWTRNRPGDRMGDKYNLNTLPRGQDETAEYDEPSSAAMIPGMGLEHGLPEHLRPPPEPEPDEESLAIPGLDFGSEDAYPEKPQVPRKIPFSKPIPIQFQQQWMENKQPLLLAPPPQDDKSQSDGDVAMPPEDGFAPSSSLHQDASDPFPMDPALAPQRASLLGEKPGQQQQPPLSGHFGQGSSYPMMPLEDSNPPTPQDMDHRDPQQDFDAKYGGRDGNSADWRSYGNDFGDQDLRMRPSDGPKDVDHRGGPRGRWPPDGGDRDERAFFGGQERDDFGSDYDERGMHPPPFMPPRGKGREGAPRMAYRQGDGSMDDFPPSRKRPWSDVERGYPLPEGDYRDEQPFNDFPQKHGGSGRGSHKGGGMYQGPRGGGGSRGGSYRGGSRGRPFRGNMRGGRSNRSGF